MSVISVCDCIPWFLSKMEDVVFADFCALIGLDNIRQYEQEHLKQQSERDRKRYIHPSSCFST